MEVVVRGNHQELVARGNLWELVVQGNHQEGIVARGNQVVLGNPQEGVVAQGNHQEGAVARGNQQAGDGSHQAAVDQDNPTITIFNDVIEKDNFAHVKPCSRTHVPVGDRSREPGRSLGTPFQARQQRFRDAKKTTATGARDGGCGAMK